MNQTGVIHVRSAQPYFLRFRQPFEVSEVGVRDRQVFEMKDGRGRIERGELRQGQKLPSEREYADQLGISLAPVRQAILDLVKEG